MPPLAAVEVLSSDRDHDLVKKAAVYARHGVDLVAVDPTEAEGWWCLVGGRRVSAARAEWQPPGWPEPVPLTRRSILTS